MVIYNGLTIERLEMNNRVNYKLEDYQYLNEYYRNKVQQIHIIGEYARKMLSDYKAALQFVEDYFKLNYASFLRRYFPNRREEINKNKKRLLKLLGNAASFVEIKTFHSFCFDLLGRVGTFEKSEVIIKEAIRKIEEGEVEPGRITKTVLVIDEAQDMDAYEFTLIKVLMEYNVDMRVIAVGDDDQNIYEFRGASSQYMKQLIIEQDARLYELVENYRSKNNLVDFSNQFLKTISNRLKHTPIIPVQLDNGKIKLVRHRGTNLITPLVKDIISQGLAGSTCVLVKTNDEALQITGFLIKEGMQAKLIQSNDGFNLYNLLEIRALLNFLNQEGDSYTINNDVWAEAKRKLKKRFCSSPNLEICLNLLKNFESANPDNKYKSDLDIFIRESKLEDFYGGDAETIYVSTIHKAKGREYDNVFLLLDNFKLETDEAKRQLYVALTRAKGNLVIHCNGSFLDFIKTEDLSIINDDGSYLPGHMAGLLPEIPSCD